MENSRQFVSSIDSWLRVNIDNPDTRRVIEPSTSFSLSLKIKYSSLFLTFLLFFSLLQVRGDLSSLYFTYNVETITGGKVCGGDMAVGSLPRRTTGYSIWHRLRRLRRQRHRCPGQCQVLTTVDINRARVWDLNYPILCAADDDHHRAVRVDRHQIATLEPAIHHRQ